MLFKFMQKAQRYACATRGKRCKRTLYSDEVYVLAFEAEPARRWEGKNIADQFEYFPCGGRYPRACSISPGRMADEIEQRFGSEQQGVMSQALGFFVSCETAYPLTPVLAHNAPMKHQTSTFPTTISAFWSTRVAADRMSRASVPYAPRRRDPLLRAIS